ncbi:hypothetical protein DNL40_02535 [Xylanimonas oleitrophica]|uniref:Uncharacterized protein n=1 Tax=Xylanimonas oleitrophica TaxID=2607479 RepID=A0A2W5WVE3_9MICO|nr:hypothetical protein [Xylanimonas oleitrophica]PZR55267.1 hypothetical protein DNL40_02535 [Xylanimonas oleitrophica]
MIPQYAKSTDRDVIAAVQRNEQGRIDFRVQARAFAQKYSAAEKPATWIHSWAGSYSLTGIAGPAKDGHGRWTKPDHQGATKPFKNNPLHTEFTAVRFRAEKVPGIDEGGYVTGYRDFSTIMHTPILFVQDGVAYMGLGGIPLSDQSGGWGKGEFDADLWAEILASEWHAAKEAHTGEAVKP